MTKYRTISDGYCERLQYLTMEKTFFGLRKKLVWAYVFHPYYHRSYGRDDVLFHKTCVCSYNETLATFPKRWPEISKYFEWASKEQSRLENIVHQKDAAVERKRGVTKELN
jgi:hypothetical protein